MHPMSGWCCLSAFLHLASSADACYSTTFARPNRVLQSATRPNLPTERAASPPHELPSRRPSERIPVQTPTPIPMHTCTHAPITHTLSQNQIRRFVAGTRPAARAMLVLNDAHVMPSTELYTTVTYRVWVGVLIGCSVNAAPMLVRSYSRTRPKVRRCERAKNRRQWHNTEITITQQRHHQHQYQCSPQHNPIAPTPLPHSPVRWSYGF